MTEPAPSPTRLGLLSSLRLGSNGAFRFLYPFLAVVARELRIPTARAGLLLASLAIGGMLSPWLRRLLVGQEERTRRLLVTSCLIIALGTVVVAAAPVAIVAVVGLLVLGAGKPLLDSASISWVSARTTFDRRARATSTMELTWAGSLVVIAPLAGLLAGATSWRLPLALLGVATALVALWGRHLLQPDIPTAPTRLGSLGRNTAPNPTTDVPVSATVVRSSTGDRSRRRLRVGSSDLDAAAKRFLLVVALVFAALEATFSVFGLWLVTVYGVSVEQLGFFAAVTATGELLGAGAVVVFADRVGKAKTMITGVVICVAGLTGLVFMTTLARSVAALALGLVGSEMAIVAAIAIASEIQPDARSRYLATMFAVTSLTRAVVGGLGPAIFTTGGIAANVAVSVTAAIAGAVLLRATIANNPQLA